MSAVSQEFCAAGSRPILFLASDVSEEAQVAVFATSSDGSDAVRIARGDIHATAVWAPDGRSVAFRKHPFTFGTDPVETEIGIMLPDGSERVSLRVAPGPPRDNGSHDLAWSPDGKTIAFSAARLSGELAVWAMSRLGGDARQLLPELEQPHFDPAWARRGPYGLAYVAQIDGVEDIWVTDPENPAQRQNITEGRVLRPRDPRWSPDGMALAFSAGDPLPTEMGGGDEEVYVWSSASAEITQVTSNDVIDSRPVWAPDGESLLIASSRPIRSADSSARPNSTSLLMWQLPLGGGEPHLLLAMPVGEQNVPVDWYDSKDCGPP